MIFTFLKINLDKIVRSAKSSFELTITIVIKLMELHLLTEKAIICFINDYKYCFFLKLRNKKPFINSSEIQKCDEVNCCKCKAYIDIWLSNKIQKTKIKGFKILFLKLENYIYFINNKVSKSEILYFYEK